MSRCRLRQTTIFSVRGVLVVLFTGFGWASNGLASSFTCADLLSFDPPNQVSVVEGRSVRNFQEAVNKPLLDHEKEFDSYLANNVLSPRYISHGAEGWVFRVALDGGDPQGLLKFFGEDPQSYNEHFSNLSLWNQVYTPKAGGLEILLPQRTPADLVLAFRDVRGESVKKVLLSPDLSPGFKHLFYQRYKAALWTFALNVKGRYPDAKILVANEPEATYFFEYLDLLELFSPFTKDVEFISEVSIPSLNLFVTLVPQNIIYDVENDRFVLFDPI